MILSLWDGLVADRGLKDRLQAVFDDFRLIDRSTFYWYPRPLSGGAVPSNPIEELAELVIAKVQPHRLAGVEYWTNSLATGEHMHLHHDKDERLFWQTRELRHPLISTVYYPDRIAFTGGELVIDAKHLVSTGPNQLAAFRGSLTHGVQKVKSGTRQSIALNLWAETPMAYGDSISELSAPAK